MDDSEPEKAFFWLVENELVALGCYALRSLCGNLAPGWSCHWTSECGLMMVGGDRVAGQNPFLIVASFLL